MNVSTNQTSRNWILIAAFAVTFSLWSPVREHKLPPDTPWHLLMQSDDASDAAVPSDTLRSLEGESMMLTGFIYPLEQGDENRFLLSPHPPGCAFHSTNGLTAMVEVFAEEAVPYTFEPIAVQGVLAFASWEGGITYQLLEATLEELP